MGTKREVKKACRSVPSQWYHSGNATSNTEERERKRERLRKEREMNREKERERESARVDYRKT